MDSDNIYVKTLLETNEENRRMKKNWDDLKEYLINYNEEKSRYHNHGRYCVAMSIVDILEKMSEIECKNSKI